MDTTNRGNDSGGDAGTVPPAGSGTDTSQGGGKQMGDGGNKSVRMKRKSFLDEIEFKERKWEYLFLHDGPGYRYTTMQVPFLGIMTFFEYVFFVWEFIILALIILNCFMVVHNAAFVFASEEMEHNIFFLHAVYGVDVIIRLLVEIWRSLTGSKYVLFKVQYTCTQFVMDLISIFPYAQVGIIVRPLILPESLQYVEHLSLLYLFRLFALYRAEKFVGRIILDRFVNEKITAICRIVFYYVLFNQLFAAALFINCSRWSYFSWAFLLRGPLFADNLNSSCYLTFRRNRALFQDLGITVPTGMQLCFFTAEFVITIFTTTGQSSTIPLRNSELIIVIMIVFTSIFINGLLGSKVLGFCIDRDAERFDLFFRLECAEKHYKLSCPDFFLKRLREYYYHFWNFRQGVRNDEIYALPLPMQESIMLNLCEPMFQKSIFFNDVDVTFLTALAIRAKIQLFNPGRILCSEAERCRRMYYLIHGEFAVRSKINNSHASAILRPGSLVGEVNLIFSIPYEMQVDCNMACQVITIEHDDILEVFALHPHVLRDLQDKFNQLTTKLDEKYYFIGEYPLIVPFRKKRYKNLQQPGVILRRKYLIHLANPDSIADDTERTYIATMPNYVASIFNYRDYTRPYRTCLLPIIFVYGKTWAWAYSWILVISIIIAGFILPPCAIYDKTNSAVFFRSLVCDHFVQFRIVDIMIPIAVCIMFILEICIAVPTSGYFHGFLEGVLIKLCQFQFYIDIVSVVFLVLPRTVVGGFFVYAKENVFIVPAMISVLQFTKVWRLFQQLDNKYPLNLIPIRFAKTLTCLVCFIHYVACYLYWITKTTKGHWMESLYRGREVLEYSGDYLRHEGGYMYPLYYATAIITSSGFSEFSSQEYDEFRVFCCLAVAFFFLLTILITELASAIACSIIPLVRFYQKLQDVNIFLKHFGISHSLAERVKEHYTLQYQFAKGVNLRPKEHFLLYDAPPYLSHAVIDNEYRNYLEGIPLFTNCQDDVYQRAIRLMQSYILPPGITFIEKGEARREMYLIVRGRVGLVVPENRDMPSRKMEEKFSSILGPSAHFGIRDLLFAERSKFDVETLSHVHVYVIDRTCLKEAFPEEETQKIQKIMEEEAGAVKTQQEKEERRNFFIINPPKNYTSQRHITPIDSWIHFPLNSKISYPYSTFAEYNRIWNFPGSVIVRRFIMDKTINPSGLFAKVWIVISGIAALGTVLSLFLELWMGYRALKLRYYNICFDLIAWIDIYLKLHWAYFTRKRHLISHPAKTASRYALEGMFFYDCCFAVPFELGFAFGTMHTAENFTEWFVLFFGYGTISTWYSKLRWVRLLQIYRLLSVFNLARSSSKTRTLNFVLCYIIFTFCLAIIFGTFFAYMGCPWMYHDWKKGLQNFLPLCYAGWVTSTIRYPFYKMWNRVVVSTYYAIQTIFCVGYGDLTDITSTSELWMVIVLTVLGILWIVYVASDITAAEVDFDEVRANFIEKKKRILYLLRRTEQRRGKNWIRPIANHMNYQWLMTRGMHSKELFDDLYPSLASNVFKELLGEQLEAIPLFQDLNDPALRYMCSLFQKVNYLRGSTIARIGNLQFEFTIIVRGSAYVCNSAFKWLCTVEEGEFFGETDMLFELPRKYGVVAATNVELLVLSMNDFKSLLTLYPNARDKMMRMLKNSLCDILECKIIPEYEWDAAYEKEANKTTKKLRNLIFRNPRSIEGLTLSKKKKGCWTCCKTCCKACCKSSCCKCKQRIIGCGEQDYDLEFLYFSSPKGSCKFLIHPNCGFIRLWEVLTMICSFLYPCFALYWVFFIIRVEGTGSEIDNTVKIVVMVVNIVCVIILLVNMVLQLLTPFELSEPGTYCKIWYKIVINYLIEPDLFLLDVVSVPPWFLFNGDLVWLTFFRLVYFYGNLRRRRKNDISVIIFTNRLYFYGSLFIVLGHVTATVFHYEAYKLSKERATWISAYKGTYIDYNDTESVHIASWYLRSLYFAFVSITTTGVGDIVPLNVNTYLVTLIAISLGAFAVSLIIANITVGLSSLSKTRRVYFYNVRLFTSYLRNLGLSRVLEVYLRAYYFTMWQEYRGVPIHKTLACLPTSMRMDVSTVLFATTLQKTQMFGTIGELTFIRNVCSYFVHSIYLPGQYVAREGEAGDFLFIVHHGEVGSYEGNNKGELEFIKKYTRGEAFGKTAVLFQNYMYMKSYRAETLTQVISLAQEELVFIARYYPRWQFYVEEYINARMQPVFREDPEARHIFMEPA